MPSLTLRLPVTPAQVLDLSKRHSNVVMFAAGFSLDLVTLRRIDGWTDLSIQMFYLVALTILLIFQHREARGQWKPPARIERPWVYNVEVLHFCYGGLLSAYVVLYLKSSTRARPMVFFALLVVLMVCNEMEQVRRAGYQLRLGLYAFCVISFLNYFLPILIGQMSGWVFLLALGASAGVVWLVADRLAAKEADPKTVRARLFMPALVVCLVIGGLYIFRLIPPVPLSVQFQGIYHDVRRDGSSFMLTYEKPPLYLFWRHDSRPFRKRPGDRLHYFVRVYAPTRFHHEVFARWEYKGAGGGWSTRDRVPLPIVGGRAEGFRAYAVKANFEPGLWRVITETEDGRAMAVLTFTVKKEEAAAEASWRTVGG